MERRRENLKEFTQNYYDYNYFANPEGCEFVLADGSKQYWSYKNPTGEYGGAIEVAKAWKTIFNPENLLDFGSGRGQFIAYARDVGIEARGFDFSEWAIGDEGRYARCRPEWVTCHDATETWPYRDGEFDLVVGLDIMEHVYLSDLPFVMGEMFRVAEKWVFLQIATVDGVREKGYVLKKGEPIPLATDGRTWAGHVHVTTCRDWEERLASDDWWLRRDVVQWFCGLVDPAIIANWLKNSIIVLEKME